MADDGESLESWLNKATNPSNRQEDWEYIMGFCDQINKELEGPQISVRLLAHKIQSPQEWEAMQALTVLEACMKNCGRRFHNEVGKFKFLNELIKVVSPKPWFMVILSALMFADNYLELNNSKLN
uniref:VHS domain-containing protein n=1 Tax=Xiphophorus couchianus TaxID=32473 RepID=A0A3B5M2M8_9TELE